MIVTTGDLYKLAYVKFAIGAYNINNMEQCIGLFEGSLQSAAPFIIQISRGARSYARVLMLEGLIRAAEELYPEAVFAVHLDHGDEKTAYECIESGFYSSVMIDASHMPFEQNIATTRRVVEAAHARGISVEAELGMLGGVEEDIAVDEKHAMLTDAAEAEEFVERSGCDSLAVAIGTSHGAYKFKNECKLAFDRVEQIMKTCPGLPLVMHGSSSVPAEYVDLINKYGGKMPNAKGVPEEQLHLAATKYGVCKVNIDSDLRLALTAKIREVFA
ncbi:MAG: ketose-bisphosphate aldolase, partial [Chloroflexi bacterium]